MEPHRISPELRKALIVRDLIERYRQAHPSDNYAPHEGGQIQFHRSQHIIRALFPGNGFGKTRCIAEEAHAWCCHSNRWQKTPDWPVEVVWVCPDFSQFGKLKVQIEGETIGQDAKLRDTKVGMFYEYPDGSRWWIASADRSWRFFQGINPDLILFDEEPPQPLWREAMVRRRGRRKTRFAVAATATNGLTWMEGTIYTPWLEFHKRAGLSLEGAVDEQIHPRIWCQPFGSAADNPGNTEDDWAWYQEQTWSSEKEQQVRLHGGFADFSGNGLFDGASLDRMRTQIEQWHANHPEWPIDGMLYPIFPNQTRRPA